MNHVCLETYLYFIKAAKAFAKKTKLAFNYITIKLNFLNTLLLQIHIVRVQRMTIKYIHIDVDVYYDASMVKGLLHEVVALLYGKS